MDNKNVSQPTKVFLLALKSRLYCLRDIQADVQRRIESVQREVNEVAEIIRSKEGKPEQPAAKEVENGRHPDSGRL